MSSMSSTPPAWEQSKENAAPLERGRNVASLGLRGRTSSKSEQNLKEKIQEYEELVRPSEALHVTEMDGDPLAHWLSYIKFYQNNFPADTRDNFLLMERCVRALVKMNQYSNDDRFVGVCAKYADKTKDPGQVFKYLHQQKVGTYTALFWIAWAFVAEKADDFPFAEKIFKKGISKNAQPLQMLKLRHQQFQRRMSRHWLNASRSANPRFDEYEDDDTRDSIRPRAALGGLSRDRIQHNDRSRGSRLQSGRNRGITSGRMEDVTNQQQQQGLPAGRSRNSSFSIFVEHESEDGYNLDQSFADENDRRIIARESERKKENTLEAERWNERGGIHSSYQRTARNRPSGPPAAFPVFVDEECAIQHRLDEDEQNRHMVPQRQVRDERTFREREGEGLAERLVQDPLRYMRNPNQFEAETGMVSTHQSEDIENTYGDTKSKSDKRSRTGFNKRLLKNKNGEEQCFEEARAHTVAYTLLADNSTNFNLLQIATKKDQSSQMDLEDGEGSMDISMAESARISVQQSTSGKPPYKLQRVGSRTQGRRLFHPDDASFEAGIDQTTISNASSAINESDAVGLPTKKEEETINTRLAMKELSMMFSSPAFGVDGNRRHPGTSFHASRINESADYTRTNESFGNLGDGVLLDNSICNAGNGSDSPNAASGNTEFDGNPAFTIYEEQLEKGEEDDVPSARPGFQIYQDDGDDSSVEVEDKKPIAYQLPTPQRHLEVNARSASEGDTGRIFDAMAILKDAKLNEYSGAENGDTASISDALKLLEDKNLDGNLLESQIDEGDTATLSLFNEVFSTETSTKERSSSPSVDGRSRPVGFDIYVDEDQESTHEGLKSSQFIERCHDMNSRDKSLSGSKRARDSISNALQQSAIDYHKCHEHDMQMALRRGKATAAVATDSRTPLFSLLNSKNTAFYISNIILPKQLRQKRVANDFEITLGKHVGILRQELGRGAYGVIYLMNNPGNPKKSTIAIKVQSPTDSLAWEFEILQRLEKRLLSYTSNNDYGFPRPLTFLSLADAGIMSMSAASDSGLNLVDLSNFYKLKLREPVPEIVALHYTSVSLRIVERLHWHGKILHCDVKPDNFVLSNSYGTQNPFRNIDFSYLTLVDFGRSLDLAQFSDESGQDVRNTMFKGTAATKEMQCIAMRHQQAWSYDADTFGIVCCAHVLLHGTHMEVKRGQNNKWLPSTALKRYWQQELWAEIFDTLLNLDDFGTAIGSRSSSLRCLRRKIETYLSDDKIQENLRFLLARQATMLPNNRAKIS